MEFKLEECTLNITDGTHSTVIDNENGKNYLLSCKNIKNGNVEISKNDRKIDDETLKKLRKRTNLEKGDVLITTVGTLGGMAIIKENNINYDFQRSVGILKPNPKIVIPEYLYYAMKNNLSNILNVARGTSQQCIFLSELKNVTINVMDKNIQEKIVKILSNIDKKIELNNQINNNLHEIINSIFKKWFIEFEFPILDGQYYKSSNGKMIDSELGEIPENWKVVKLESIIDFSNGYSIDSKKMLDKEEKNTYKVFKMGNIKPLGGINKDKTKSWLSKEYCTGLEKYISKKGDILMCMTDMKNSDTPLLGHTALIDKNNEFIINQRVGILRCKKEFVNYPFVYTLTNLDFFVKDIRSRANSGVQVNLSTKAICETSLIFPDKKTLDEFNNIAEPMYEQIFKNNDENELLIQIRDTLLPKLMNGEIDLDNIEI